MKIKLLYLVGCDVCKKFMGALDKANVEYEAIDADQNDKLADYVEDLTGTNTYPILIIEKSNQIAYLFRADDAEQLKARIVGDSEMVCGFFNADSMMDYLITLLN